MKQLMVRSRALIGYTEACASLRIDPIPLLNAFSLPVAPNDNQDQFIPYKNFIQLLNHTAEKSGDRYFGLRMAHYRNESNLGPIGLILLSAKNVETALRSLELYLKVQNQGINVTFQTSNNLVQADYLIETSVDEPTGQVSLLNSGFFFKIMRIICGSDWAPHSVWTIFNEPEDISVLNQFLRCPIRFNQEANRIFFDVNVLTKTFTGANPDLFKILSQHLEVQLKASTDNIIDQVRIVISQLLPSKELNIESVANLLSLSKRSLQRQLSNQGTSFSELTNEVRHEQALRYLRESSISLTELALLLGYSEASVFSRAFKRKEGVSPQQWREKHLQ